MTDGHVALRASVGFAWTIAIDESPDALVARADAAMYKSKLDGRGSVVQGSSDGHDVTLHFGTRTRRGRSSL